MGSSDSLDSRPKPPRQPSSFDKMFGKKESTPTTTAATSIKTVSSTNATPDSSAPQSPVMNATSNNIVAPLNGQLPPPAMSPAPPKSTIGNQLQRIFSRSGKSKESGGSPTLVSENASETDKDSIESANGEKPQGASAESKGNGKVKTSPKLTAERKASIMEAPKAVNCSKDPSQFRRFNLKEDGTHDHVLKSAKRQEKLSGLFRDMITGKRREENPENDGLGLVSSWVDQLKADKERLAADKKGGPTATATLIEKYGKCQEVVGRGAFGIVRISHKIDPNNEKREQLYAVKEFRRRPQETAKKYTKRLTSEFCISSSLRHPNVIHTLDLLQDAKGDYCEVMEFCAGGDLYSLVLAAGKLEVLEADCYFKQLMRGVEYMHEMGVAHRDLKPENLLLTNHGALKITDFGNGECFRMAWEKEAHKTGGLCGSAPYISPEEYIEKEFDPRAVDVWATGVIYMAMRTGRHLWRVAKRDEDEFFDKYLEGRKDEGGYGPIEGLHRARCRNVIYSVLDPNPTRRITASQVLKSEWGREIKVCRAGEEGF